MENDQNQQQYKIDDNVYMKIWLADQDFVKTRWTITTFFMSVSFAILAYSLCRELRCRELRAQGSGLFLPCEDELTSENLGDPRVAQRGQSREHMQR